MLKQSGERNEREKTITEKGLVRTQTAEHLHFKIRYRITFSTRLVATVCCRTCLGTMHHFMKSIGWLVCFCPTVQSRPKIDYTSLSQVTLNQ